VKQDKKIIPFKYWQKDMLNYEKLYVDLLIKLLIDKWDLQGREQISVILDNFKTKIISKVQMIKKVRHAFGQKYPGKFFKVRFADSAGDFNLQIADFIVGTYFKNFKKGLDLSDFCFGQGLRLNIVVNIL
jgi:hypothetical protein